MNSIWNKILVIILIGTPLMNGLKAQRKMEEGSLDPLSYGVVLDDPGMNDVKVKTDLVYLSDEKGTLHFDLYAPPQKNPRSPLPAIIFLNAIGEREGGPRVKSWGIYKSWPRLMAAKGYIGISMETDGTRVSQSISALFDFLTKQAGQLNIDATRLGVYAASANVSSSLQYVMSNGACQGIKAAVLYYGGRPQGPFRKDLLVFFVVSEGDVQRTGYAGLWNEVLKNNAPWTIVMGTGMPHAFDAYSDNENARKIIKQTIAFWKDQLDPVEQPSFPHSQMRDVFGYLRMDPSKALNTLQQLSEKHSGDIRILSFYANALHETGHQEQAAGIYQKVLAIDPGYTPALLSMTAYAYSKNDSITAQKYIAELSRAGNISAGTYGDLGFLLLVAGRDREAAIYYEKALALQPNGHDFYNLACAYAKYGEKEKAFASLSRSLALGYPTRSLVEQDDDLTSLRSDARYAEFMKRLE